MSNASDIQQARSLWVLGCRSLLSLRGGVLLAVGMAFSGSWPAGCASEGNLLRDREGNNSRAIVFDRILRGATIVDGSGSARFVGDVALLQDRIAAVGSLRSARAVEVWDVSGKVLAPGFINMLSWADESLLVDGRSLSDMLQGVTLEVFGEGTSMGPLNPTMREELLGNQSELRYEISWSTLGEYLDHLERRGVSTNVASFVGAGTVRQYVLGYENRAPRPEELDAMRQLVAQAMREGAMGVGSSLPYVPGAFATTEELAALAEVAGRFGGLYISHIRDEGERLLESLDEFLEIVRRTGTRGEVYHLKASGRANWGKIDAAIQKLEAARASGLAVTANVYPYPASSTGLTYALPHWMLEGGFERLLERLRNPEIRARARAELSLIPPGDLVLTNFRKPELRRYLGWTLEAVAKERGKHPEEILFDLLLEDESHIGTVRFVMSEENVRRLLALPWVSIGSDGASVAPEPPFTSSLPHPRAYGTFARILGKYVREEQILSLEEAIRKMTSLPAQTLGLDDRGRVAPGFYADLVIFDADRIRDRATYTEPHQLAEGVLHVFVNGVAVIQNGQHTGAKPGRFVRGPGARRRMEP